MRYMTQGQINMDTTQTTHTEDLVYRLRKRAEIRRQIPTRKSVQEGEPDRLADLLDEAADEIVYLKDTVDDLQDTVNGLTTLNQRQHNR
jgi:hypothetical protein